MIKNAPFGARFLMKSGSGNEEIVTVAQITQGEGYARVRSTIAGVAETGGICKGAERHCRRRRDGWAEIHQRRENPLTRLRRELFRRESLKEEKSCILYR